MTAEIINTTESIAECSECGETNRWVIFLNIKREISYFMCAGCGGTFDLEECDENNS